MTVICIIPARGGSKRIERKNVAPLLGSPLVWHTVRQAVHCPMINEVWVSTDDDEIAQAAENAGARIAWRSEELSGDKATSESALLEVLDHRLSKGLSDPELVVFLQCTSPIRGEDDLANAIGQLRADGADSLLSVTENKRFLWKRTPDGSAQSINYDFNHRKREQDFDADFQENGSIYITRTALLRSTSNRLGGKISLYVMDYWTGFQVDEPEDMKLIEWIMTWAQAEKVQKVSLPEPLELVVFDFDGVMTDDCAYVDENGRESVRVSRSDGMGVELLRKAGVRMLVLSKEQNPVVSARCKKLQIEVAQSVEAKHQHLETYLHKHGIEKENVVYVGNDINDLECMSSVGCAVAVQDAHPRILSVADVRLNKCGGDGAVRELAELILVREPG